MRKLHPTQLQLLEILENHITDPLSLRDLQEELDLSSASVVLHHVRQLEAKGFLRRNPSNPADYQILSKKPDSKIAFLNLYGIAHCGPNGFTLDDTPEERIPISAKILGFQSKEAFLVRAKGTSMAPKINNRDLVIIQRSDIADNGTIVLCVNNGEALIKRIRRIQDTIFLDSENKKFETFVAARDFRVVGRVRGILSYSI